MPGRLIVIEGAEGAGKTTQLRLLAEHFRSQGLEVLPLREPGGTALGDSIRTLVLDTPQEIEAAAEALLFLASRAQLVRREIDPALARGVVVLMDRFFLSTYAYQIHGRGLDEDQVRSANALATGGLVPDLTIVLEISAAEGMARASGRGEHDRIERSGTEFHDRVEEAFRTFAHRDWQRAHPECGPIAVVNGRGATEEVHARIVARLSASLGNETSHAGTRTGATPS